jgi:hypothetical protein
MSKVKMTISVPDSIAEYLRSTAGVSSTIAEAVEAYRARELEATLEEAYRADAEEAERLNEEWESANAEVDS